LHFLSPHENLARTFLQRSKLKYLTKQLLEFLNCINANIYIPYNAMLVHIRKGMCRFKKKVILFACGKKATGKNKCSGEMDVSKSSISKEK